MSVLRRMLKMRQTAAWLRAVVERSRTRYPRRISARRHSVLALSAYATKIGRSLVPAQAIWAPNDGLQNG
jgi:hypothetical protein